MTYDCYCDGDSPTWCTIRDVKRARKPHKCDECSAPMPLGSPYEYTSGLWDGMVMDFHICPLCVELRQWATISVPCFCWTYGDLHENVRDMVREVAPTLPGFFMEFGRRMVKIRQVREAAKHNAA